MAVFTHQKQRYLTMDKIIYIIIISKCKHWKYKVSYVPVGTSMTVPRLSSSGL